MSSKLRAAGSLSVVSSAPSRKTFHPVTANVTGGCQLRCGTVLVGEVAEIDCGAVALGAITTTEAGADDVELPTESVAVTT